MMISDNLMITTVLATTFSATILGYMVLDYLDSDLYKIRSRVRQKKNSVTREDVPDLFGSLDRESVAIKHRSILAKIEEQATNLILHSGLNWSYAHLRHCMLFCGLLTMAILLCLNVSLNISLLLFPVGLFVPIAHLLILKQRRLSKIASQLPEAFDMMRRAVQAGHTLDMAMKIAAHEMRPPLSHELARVSEQTELGLPQDLIMKEMATRNPLMELRIFSIAMLVQRQHGGSPTELLEKLSMQVRNRMRLTNRVKALTGEGRMQALVLFLIPVAAFFAIYLMDRRYAQELIDLPWLLGGLIASQLLGTLWIRKIINFEY